MSTEGRPSRNEASTVHKSDEELATMESDAGQLYSLEQLNEAETLYRQLLDSHKESGGPTAALRNMHNLSATLVKQQKFQEAVPMLRQLHVYLTQRTSGRETQAFIEQEASCSSLLDQALKGQ